MPNHFAKNQEPIEAIKKRNDENLEEENQNE